jgi:hypothetical protein
MAAIMSTLSMMMTIEKIDERKKGERLKVSFAYL